MVGLNNLKRMEDFISVVKYSHPIQRRLVVNGSGSVKFAEPDHELTRTQDLEDFFHDSGQFYWGKKSAWLQEKRMHSDGIAFEISRLNSVDIDNEVDWKIAEAIFAFHREVNINEKEIKIADKFIGNSHPTYLLLILLQTMTVICYAPKN